MEVTDTPIATVSRQNTTPTFLETANPAGVQALPVKYPPGYVGPPYIYQPMTQPQHHQSSRPAFSQPSAIHPHLYNPRHHYPYLDWDIREHPSIAKVRTDHHRTVSIRPDFSSAATNGPSIVICLYFDQPWLVNLSRSFRWGPIRVPEPPAFRQGGICVLEVMNAIWSYFHTPLRREEVSCLTPAEHRAVELSYQTRIWRPEAIGHDRGQGWLRIDTVGQGTRFGGIYPQRMEGYYSQAILRLV